MAVYVAKWPNNWHRDLQWEEVAKHWWRPGKAGYGKEGLEWYTDNLKFESQANKSTGKSEKYD